MCYIGCNTSHIIKYKIKLQPVCYVCKWFFTPSSKQNSSRWIWYTCTVRLGELQACTSGLYSLSNIHFYYLFLKWLLINYNCFFFLAGEPKSWLYQEYQVLYSTTLWLSGRKEVFSWRQGTWTSKCTSFQVLRDTLVKWGTESWQDPAPILVEIWQDFGCCFLSRWTTTRFSDHLKGKSQYQNLVRKHKPGGQNLSAILPRTSPRVLLESKNPGGQTLGAILMRILPRFSLGSKNIGNKNLARILPIETRQDSH